MRLKELMKIADKGYGMGPGYIDRKGRCVGDSLSDFVISELSETFDETASTDEQLDRAIRVMEVAVDDLRGVIKALSR